MFRERLKKETHTAHQKTEGTVIRKIKQVESDQDYIEILKCFYSYFKSVENEIAPFITSEVLPDKAERRDSSYIQKDIEELGGSIEKLPPSTPPKINNTFEALCALYVLEGSIMGGPYIIKMLEKRGIQQAFSFFSGYGKNSGKMFGIFAEILNNYAKDSDNQEKGIETANETFRNFGAVFQHLVKVN